MSYAVLSYGTLLRHTFDYSHRSKGLHEGEGYRSPIFSCTIVTFRCPAFRFANSIFCPASPAPTPATTPAAAPTAPLATLAAAPATRVVLAGVWLVAAGGGAALANAVTNCSATSAVTTWRHTLITTEHRAPPSMWHLLRRSCCILLGTSSKSKTALNCPPHNPVQRKLECTTPNHTLLQSPKDTTRTRAPQEGSEDRGPSQSFGQSFSPKLNFVFRQGGTVLGRSWYKLKARSSRKDRI